MRRRLEVRGKVDGVTVIDDFAHHPTAIALTIAGLREQVGPQARIIALLEPRSNTMRQGATKDQLAGALDGADRIYCLDAGLDWAPGEVLAPLGDRCQIIGSVDQMADIAVAGARPGDTLLAMSNGAFGGIHQKLLDGLAKRVAGA